MKHKTIFIDCDCHTHLLQVIRDSDMPCFDVSYYCHGRTGNKFGLWWKLKLIWRIITKGTAYGDDIILNDAEARKLIRFLTTGLKVVTKPKRRWA